MKADDALARPSNFVGVVNGHHLYRCEDGQHCDLWTPGVGWWGFALSEDDARRICKTVSQPSAQGDQFHHGQPVSESSR